MLSRPFALHQPGCDGRNCAPNECVRDVEAFCGALLERFHRGERVAHQPGSHAFLSRDDHDDAIAHLVGASWEAWRRFNPVDDGRGTNRFGGYLSWVLYRRHTDWLRRRYGSTRYGPVATFTPTADPEVHITDVWLDAEYDDGDYGLDLEAAPAGTREALELIQPLIDGESLTQGQLAVRGGVSTGRVQKAMRLVREEARRQGLEPIAGR
jgi:DNA-directed RNA polymerase specialized sigma24 family protein